MKIPKTLYICSEKWKITVKNKTGGGYFNGNKNHITVCTKNKPEILKILMHEVIESIITERGFRWRMYENENDKLLFSFNHADFVNICDDITAVIRQLLENQ